MQTNGVTPRFPVASLERFASRLLEAAGLPRDRAEVVADVLIEADLQGHTTHGLQLLAGNLRALEAGQMASTGEPTVVADHGGALTWDGNYLPGPWLVRRAMAEAFDRVKRYKVSTVVIRRSHHIACLQAYLKQATDQNLVMLLFCSDPSYKSVAPHGAVEGCYSPTPIAAGLPTEGDPVWMDFSMSATTNGRVGRLNRAGRGEHLPGAWLVDRQGKPTDDPGVVLADPPGAILPLGGIDLGHKGFGLGILFEILTSALGGYGRADKVPQAQEAVFLQILDPEAFGGLRSFLRESTWLASACRKSAVAPGAPPVRLPGERGLSRRAEQIRDGVTLHPEILPALAGWAKKFGIEAPVGH